jgi:hypothetical protein
METARWYSGSARIWRMSTLITWLCEGAKLGAEEVGRLRWVGRKIAGFEGKDFG